jgi:hypothetical protein
MPINCVEHHSLKCGAIWTYIPNEYIDFNNYSFVKILRIECVNQSELLEPSKDHSQRKIYPRGAKSHYYYNWSTTPPTSSDTIENVPYILPSIKHLFPILETLIISNGYDGITKKNPVYIDILTDIPPTVKMLNIEYTMITNIGEIIHTCPNLELLKLHNNLYHIYIPLQKPLPVSLTKLNISMETFTNELYVHDNLHIITILNSNIPGIQNLKYNNKKNLIMYGCETPYDNAIFYDNNLSQYEKIKHIQLVNSCNIYQHFGSIPTRIRVSSNEDLENPIIIALHLASNYPRRMAEFISDLS